MTARGPFVQLLSILQASLSDDQQRCRTACAGEPSARNNTGPPLRPRELGRLSKSSRCLVRPAPCDTVVGTEQLSRSRNAHQASSFPFDPEVADSEMRGGQGQVSTGAVATMESGHSLSLARPRRCGRRAVGLLSTRGFKGETPRRSPCLPRGRIGDWNNACARKRFGKRAVRGLCEMGAKLIQDVKSSAATDALPHRLRPPWLWLSTWPAAALASKSVLIGASPFHERRGQAPAPPSPPPAQVPRASATPHLFRRRVSSVPL